MSHFPSVLSLVNEFREGQRDLHTSVQAWLTQARHAEPSLKAFAHLSDAVIEPQVQRLQAWQQSGQPLPPLFGVPVGIKDNIDTADYPTELGFEPARGRQPAQDAWVVHRLRQAGAIIWGKTHTTELAYFQPAPTENPRAPGHTPGGSSSGSAAAIAAGVLPAAVGTQTNGSVIRPASFCGIHAYKPSRGLISNQGSLNCSHSLDQIGVFANSVDDLAALGQAVIGGHLDEAGHGVLPIDLLSVAQSPVVAPPKLLFSRTPFWNRLEPSAQQAFEAFVGRLADCLSEGDLPGAASQFVPWHKEVMFAEMTHNLSPLVSPLGDRASKPLKDLLAYGHTIQATRYLQAWLPLRDAHRVFDEVFAQFDAIVVPAALGPAPKTLASTGNPLMCTIWQYAGMPSVNLPLLYTADGLPMGVQVVGRFGQDARLLRTARWLQQRAEQGA